VGPVTDVDHGRRLLEYRAVIGRGVPHRRIKETPLDGDQPEYKPERHYDREPQARGLFFSTNRGGISHWVSAKTAG